jgi:hypothetical protein
VQRSESLGSTKTQAAQIQDDRMTTHVGHGVLGQGAGVGRVDVTVGAYQGRLNTAPCNCFSGDVMGRSGRADGYGMAGVSLGPPLKIGAAGRAEKEGRTAVMVILTVDMITGVSGAERMLLEFWRRTAELSWTS